MMILTLTGGLSRNSIPLATKGGMLDVSAFSTLFPRYRDKYLQDAWLSVNTLRSNSLALLPISIWSAYNYSTLKQLGRIVEDCMLNQMHHVYHIKVLMIKKDLEKDPALANENWDRFLPKFKMSIHPINLASYCLYGTFILILLDIELETGEYFLSEKKKTAKKWEDKMEKQAEKTAESQRKREVAFIPPKKKAKELKNQKSFQNINAEEYIAASGKKHSKKKAKRS
ncbi:hypothetical protein ACFE04_013853 [Oxalis oulophora]